jgi:hypothetical protein
LPNTELKVVRTLLGQHGMHIRATVDKAGLGREGRKGSWAGAATC